MIRAHLFRWHKRTQLDIGLPGRWLSIGWDRRDGLRPVLYVSPDATPQRATFNINGGTR